MASLSFSSGALPSSLRTSKTSHGHAGCLFSPQSSSSSTLTSLGFRRRPQTTAFKVSASAAASSSSSSSSSFDDLSSGFGGSSRSKKTLLSDLIQEIEPLDVSVIQKEVPPTTVDAMKRTISGMLGLLPSNQFQVLIDASWESLSRLLLSSLMTGYTLRNAEYRLCLERNLGIHEANAPHEKSEDSRSDVPGLLLDSVRTIQASGDCGDSFKSEEISTKSCDEVNLHGLGEIAPEVRSYILHLQSRLSSVKKELHEVKRKNAALEMQQFVGEEKNELLDYLRSLQPEKVAELSEVTSPEVREMIHSVVHGLLATLSPKMHTRTPPLVDKNSTATLNDGNEDFAELTENTSLPFQTVISLTRDYLARLLFWCMLLGHYLRGIEYRMELTDLLSLPSDAEDGTERVV